MKRLIIQLLICCIVGLTPALAEQFTATGRGTTDEAAFSNARSAAVNLAVRQVLDDDTIARHRVTLDKALRGKAGKLTRVLQKSDPEFTGAGYEVQITADVNMKALENEINALGLLQEAMGNPRIMVLYNPNLPQGARLGHSRADLEAFYDNSYGAIVDMLVEKGFDIIDKGSAQQFSIQVAETHEIDVDTNKAAAYGLKYNADLVLYYQTVGIGKEGSYAGGAAKIFLRAQLINPTTARIIASKDVESGSYAGTLQEALYRAAKDVGQKISVVMIDAVKKHWKREKSGAGTFIVVLDGVSDAEEVIAFKNALSTIPGMSTLRERESGGGKTTFEIRTDKTADDVKRAVLRSARMLGWPLALIRSEGARSSWKRTAN